MGNSIATKQFIIAFFLFTFSPIALSSDILHHGQNLTDRQTLVSSKSVFELGFFCRGSPTKCFVGIWFTVSTDIVVWVANRNCPLNNTSGTLGIDSNGVLELHDASQKVAWQSVRTSYGSSPILQLQDTGNLILKDLTSKTVIWQSFDYPTDTLLPGMKVGKNLRTGFETYLSSWKNSDDPATGEYSYKMDTQGTPEIIMWDQQQIRYRTGMWNGLYFSGQPTMETYTSMFTFLFVSNQSEVSYEYQAKPYSLLSRLVLTDSGMKKRLVWVQSSHTWNEFSLAPKDECDYYAKCGPFSACQPDGMTSCSCLRGFEPAESTEWLMRNNSGGCQRRKPLGCTANSDGFYVLKGVKVPDSHNATVDANISVEECKMRCLRSCSCLAYSPFDIKGEGSGCVMWNTALVDIKYVNGEQDLHVKVSKSELGTSNKKQSPTTVGIISSSIILVLISSLLYLLWRKKKKRYSKQDEKQKYLMGSDSFKGTDLPVFDMDTILQATDNFSITNKLGEGGFGIVYKGQLQCGQEIAVKRLSKDSQQGLNEFMNEVMLIAKLQHRNLVRLLGCCIDNNERLLIYEFMTNGSLDFFIFDPTRRASLNWTTRLEIVVGIARGLLYLHQDSRFNIIHRDLKAVNVLLDEEMNPKISDFGTARLFRREQGVINTETVIGTRGYMSPEYVLEGAISTKSDVYSFGVLLLEIISGKKNQGNQNLLAYAWKLWEERKPLKLLDEAVERSAFATHITRCVHVGLLCVQECPDDRPSMSSFFTMLSSDMMLPDPKKPLVGERIRGFPSDWSLYEYDSSTVDQLTITGIKGR